jgi:hypothetical protein
MEVSSPTVLPVARVQAPLRRRPRIFHGGERRTRTVTLARSFAFEATPAALAGSLSMLALPPDASRREMAEDGAHDAHGVTAAARFPAGADHLAGSSSTSRRRSNRN